MKKYLPFLFFSFLGSQIHSQLLEKEKLLPAYTYSLAKNIEWPPDNGPLKIELVSSDPKLLEEFRLLCESQKLGDRELTVSQTSSPIVSLDTDVVFIDKDYNAAVRSILDQVKGDQILTITDSFSDNRFVMINFIVRDDQTLSFQINRANIINQGLKVLPDMILLGGDEVDVARLYREAQDSILLMEQKIGGLQYRFDSLRRNVKRTTKAIQDQNKIITSQNKEIARKQLVVDRQKQSLDSLKYEFQGSEKGLDSLVTYLNQVRSELEVTASELESQKNRVRKGNEILQAQNELIDEREQEISDRKFALEELELVVLSQKNLLFYIAGFSIILILFSVITYRAYIARRKDARELSEQKKELELTQTQLVQSEKMASLGVLIAGIAHEINNSINFVYSGIHIIKSKLTELNPIIKQVNKLQNGKDIKERVKKIVALKEELEYYESQNVVNDMVKNVQIGAERTIEIVKGLQTFSRAENEQKTKIDIHEDIDLALLLLESKHKDSVKVEKRFQNNLPEIWGYDGKLSQAFLNVIGNAIDAVEGMDNPKVLIRTKHKSGEVEISIKDNGRGLDESISNKIFDPFFTTKGVGVGTGLGLSIALGIIEKHNGTIKLESKPGDIGCEFVIKLPVD